MKKFIKYAGIIDIQDVFKMSEEEGGEKPQEIPGLIKPVKEGQEMELTIENESRRGEGVAKINNFVIFVKGAKTGEKIKVKITKVGRTHAEAEKI